MDLMLYAISTEEGKSGSWCHILHLMIQVKALGISVMCLL